MSLVTAEVELPNSLREELRQRAAFSQSFIDFAKHRMTGFDQPVAATAAVIAPVLMALTYSLGGVRTLAEVTVIFALATFALLTIAWLTRKDDLELAYEMDMERRKRASEDLRKGLGVEFSYDLPEAPLLVEYDQGLIVLASASKDKTLFFDVDGTGRDDRWFRYLRGDFMRQNWRWFRLKGSGAVEAFEAAGPFVPTTNIPLFTGAPDAWEAIMLALGEPRDGDIINLPFSEACKTVKRLL